MSVFCDNDGASKILAKSLRHTRRLLNSADVRVINIRRNFIPGAGGGRSSSRRYLVADVQRLADSLKGKPE